MTADLSPEEARTVRWFGIHDSDRRRAAYRQGLVDQFEVENDTTVGEWPVHASVIESQVAAVRDAGLAAVEQALRDGLAERFRELADEASHRLALVAHKNFSMEKAAVKAEVVALRAAVDLVEGWVL